MDYSLYKKETSTVNEKRIIIAAIHILDKKRNDGKPLKVLMEKGFVPPIDRVDS